MTLTNVSGPITSTTPGEVIQNLDITMPAGSTAPAINVTSANVTIENVQIHIGGTQNGISSFNTTGLKISNVEVDGPSTYTTNAGDGPEGTQDYYGITTNSALTASNVTFRDVGTGILAIDAPTGNVTLTNIDGYDMQGPYPGGQLVQFTRSAGETLNGFYVDNHAATSHPEDDISIFDSANDTVENGVIDGDNSPSGVGVMVDSGSTGATVKNVDAIHMGDGAFSAYGNNSTFTNVRSFDNIQTDQGRGAPLSNGLIFGLAGNNDSIQGTYTDPASSNISYISGSGDTINVTNAPTATPMTPVVNTFPWSTPGPAPTPSPTPTPTPTPPSVGDTLILNLSEDAYKGNAQFDVTVNGQTIDQPTQVTALHGSSQTEAFTFTGSFGTAPTVGVTFLNDLYAGTPQTDRNLYIMSSSYDGTKQTLNHASFNDGTFSFKA